MAIVPIARLVSNEMVYVRDTRTQAVEALLNDLLLDNPTPPAAINLTSISEFYPRLQEFENNNSVLGQTFGNPNFIWDSITQLSGALKGFATGFTFKDTDFNQMVLFLQAFADNAMITYVQIFDEKKNLVIDISPPYGLTHGDMNPITGVVSDTQPPYGWQVLRYYSNLVDTNLAAGTYAMVVSFEVSNYEVPDNAPTNPAALAFVVDFYGTLLGD